MTTPPVKPSKQGLVWWHYILIILVVIFIVALGYFAIWGIPIYLAANSPRFRSSKGGAKAQARMAAILKIRDAAPKEGEKPKRFDDTGRAAVKKAGKDAVDAYEEAEAAREAANASEEESK